MEKDNKLNLYQTTRFVNVKNMRSNPNSFKIFCERKGKGKPQFVFIHGTGGDHSQLAPQIEFFRNHGSVFSLDLRGHGKSDNTPQKYNIESFADDIQRVLLSQEIIKPILVGMSMGGNIGIELASRHLNFAKALILLDSTFLYSPEVLDLMKKYATGIQESFETTIHEIINNSLLPTDKHRAQITKSFLSTPQQVWSAAFNGMLEWDQKAPDKLRNCKLPILYIEASKQLINIAQFKELCPQLIHGKTVGSGHFISLEVPEQVNAMIEHFLKIYV